MTAGTVPAGDQRGWIVRLSRFGDEPPVARVGVAGLLLFAAVAIVYGAVGEFQFLAWDDHWYVTKNVVVQSGLTMDGIAWAFRTLVTGNWHPLTWISHMADVEMFGLSPGGPHVVNAVLHGVNALLLWWVLSALTGDYWRSLLVAALFAVHPLNVESVAWVSQRKTLLCVAFMLLGLRAYVAYLRKGRVGPDYLIACTAAVLASMSKPIAVVFPVLLVLLDAWSGRWGRSSGVVDGVRRILVDKVPFAAMALVLAIVTWVAQRGARAMSDLGFLDVPDRVGNALLGIGNYLWGFLIPSGLSYFYPIPDSVDWAAAIVALVAVVGISTAAGLAWRHRPALLIGWLWFLVTLLPVIGFVQVGLQARADRYMYLPIIGLWIAFGWGVMPREIRNVRSVVLFCIVVLVAYGVLSNRQAQTWRSTESMVLQALRVDPNNCQASNMLVSSYLRSGRPDRAEAHLQSALANCRGRSEEREAWTAAGDLRSQSGDYRNAREFYRRAIGVDEMFVPAWLRYSHATLRSGDHDEAIRSAERALLLAPPDSVERRFAWLAVGNALLEAGHLERAASVLSTGAAEYAQSPELWYYLANALRLTGRAGPALEAYGRVLSLNPGFPGAAGEYQALRAESGGG